MKTPTLLATIASFALVSALQPFSPAAFSAIAGPTKTKYNWMPEAANQPVGSARGIFPGRVVWAHDPGAAHWNGNLASLKNPWWDDASTDPKRTAAMLTATLRGITGKQSDADAWRAIFEYYNKTIAPAMGIQRPARGYAPGEIVAIKVNLNSTSAREPRKDSTRHDESTDITPQIVLAMVRQLVNEAGVAQKDILIYDAKRIVFTELLQKIWAEFPDVRFLQERSLVDDQRHPKYGDFSRIEQPKWTTALAYSNGKIKNNARNQPQDIPQQVLDATYSINLALLKAHSYPYGNVPNMEKGDEGQTGVTMTGKNHYGSIQGPSDLHNDINTNKNAGRKNVYTPIVDLAASPALGAKTILYVLDGMYVARKHSSGPIHFPNAPFNNKNFPYENPEWPSCILASLDGVALDSVGLDILYSQTRDNIDRTQQNRPWLLIRENADDYLHEMAQAANAPSGVRYTQAGKPVPSLGVHEHWNNDHLRQYSRNLDPKNGKGIELVYLRADAKNGNFATPPLPRRNTSQGVASAFLPHYNVEQPPANWAVATAESIMARYPDYREAYWKPWNYVTGYMLNGFEMLYKKTGDKKYFDYIKTYIDNFVDAEGNFLAINPGNNKPDLPSANLDNIMTGSMLVALYEHTRDERYKKAAQVFRRAFDDYPRNPDGGFWHGRGTTGQMWIDGIFMGQMFLTRYGAIIADPQDARYCFDEAAKQILVYAKHEKGNSGLYYHGWTANPELREWADKKTGLSTDVWAEGLGWYALIISETLKLMPSDHAKRADIVALHAKLAAGLKNAQDPQTGGWWNIVDKGGQRGNFIDPSGTAMFVYMLKRGIEQNLLDAATYGPVVERGYAALLALARVNEYGLVDVWGGCDGVSIQKDYDAYAARKRMVNAKETYAGFLWAVVVMEKYAK